MSTEFWQRRFRQIWESLEAEKERKEMGESRIEFETDPYGIGTHEPGAKLDAGKADLTFLADWSNALALVCRVAEYGANKYSRHGWFDVPRGYWRYTKAMLRHALGVGDLDPIPGVPPEHVHDAQVAWNALSRLEIKLTKGTE